MNDFEKTKKYIANITHDMRTPVNGILGYCDILKDCKESERGEILKESLEAIEYSANILLELVNNIVDMSRIEAGKFELHKSSFSLKKFYNEISKLSSGFLQKNNNTISYALEGQGEDVNLDKMRLTQVLLNLISNANKYTSNDTICVKFVVTDTTLCFSVEDHGSGIDPAILDTIQDEFVQEKSQVNQNITGSGLGLSIVNAIVASMKGKVSVASKPGKTVFSVELPVDRTKIIPRKIPTVLLVDDDADVREVIKDSLEDSGLRVLEADNGVSAVQVYENECPDLVIADIYMPVMNGIDMAKELLKKDSSAKIIIASGADIYKNQANNLGILKFFGKPLDDAFISFVHGLMPSK